jgi:hypothetical protein
MGTREEERPGPLLVPNVVSGSLRMLASHLVFDKADHASDDCPGNAAAYCLSKDKGDIYAPSSPSEHGQKRGEKLSTANAAKCARDSVADLAEVVVLEVGTSDVAADGTGYQLDNEIDDSG